MIRFLFKGEQDGKNQRGKNEASKGKVLKSFFRDRHRIPHFIAIISEIYRNRPGLASRMALS
jgi:hypothetical protein